MTTKDDVLKLARLDIGLTESPPNSNKTKFGKWYGADGQPWCAMAVSYWFFHAGLPLPITTSKGFAYTPYGASWFKRNGRWTTKPQPGHVVFFDFPGDGVNRISHVGIVESVNSNGSVVCIEGNTSRGTSGSQRDGGGVYRRTRSTGIVGYGIPDYASKEVKPMYDPSLILEPIAASAQAPNGGVWLLAESGAVYAFGDAPYHGGANSGPVAPHFAGRKAARIQANNRNGYDIISTNGEVYSFPV